MALREDGRATDVEGAMRRVAEMGRRAWAGVDVPDEALAAWLAERAPDGGDPVDALAALHAADLYLACACARGDARALGCFEASVMPHVGPAVARIDPDATFGRDVAEEVRVKLLVGVGGAPPRIGTYLGRGPLTAFVQVAAMRAAYS